MGGRYCIAFSCATLARVVCDDILPRHLIPTLLLHQLLFFPSTCLFFIALDPKAQGGLGGVFCCTLRQRLLESLVLVDKFERGLQVPWVCVDKSVGGNEAAGILGKLCCCFVITG
jgi:hypothetical protein